MTEHEVLRRVAHHRAIHEQRDVMSVSMLAALLQAVVDRVQTDVMAIGARMDALVFLRSLMFMDVSHCFVSFWVGIVGSGNLTIYNALKRR